MLALYLHMLIVIHGPLNLDKCCNKPALVPEKTLEKCLIKHGSSRSPFRAAIDGPCLYECIANGTNLVDHGRVKEARVLKFLMDQFSNDEEWKSLIHEVTETCVKKVNSLRKTIMKAQHGDMQHTVYDSKCDPTGGALLACLNLELFKKCPKSKRNPSSQCEFYFDPHHDKELKEQSEKDMDVAEEDVNEKGDVEESA